MGGVPGPFDRSPSPRPVEARIGAAAFTTSLFPKDGRYLLPLRDAVRKPQGITVDDQVTVEMRLQPARA